MSGGDVFNVSALEKLVRVFRGQQPEVRVGILGGGARTEGGASNAEVGAAHEYGTENTPKRSFLRMPIIEEMDKRLYSKGEFDEAELRQVIREGKTTAWLNKIRIIAEQVVQEAFDTSGFGKWKKLKAATLARKRNAQILVETTQLRRSITSEIKE